MSFARLLTPKNLVVGALFLLCYALVTYHTENVQLRTEIQSLKVKVSEQPGKQSSKTSKLSDSKKLPHLARDPGHRDYKGPKAQEEALDTTTTTETSTTTSTTTTTTTTTTSTTTSTTTEENSDDNSKTTDVRIVREIHSKPYDSSRGTPTDEDLLRKRDFVRGMMKFAWDGYREKAWGYNEVRPDTGRPSTNNIFGAAQTGATIIDALDTLWIMGLKDEFEDGAAWVKDNFSLKLSSQSLSAFETVIRFLGGLMGAYRMSGNFMFVEKAIDVARSIDPAFSSGPLPAAHFNPSSGRTDSMSGRILSEVGSFHLEYYDLAHAANDQKWLDRAFGIRDCLANTQTMDGLYFNRLSRPIKREDGTWYSKSESRSISLGAEGDSFYEYLIKAYVQSGKRDIQAKDMYDRTTAGAKKWLLKDVHGTRFFADYPSRDNSMQHLACFAGGMFAYGDKFAEDDDQLKIGADVTESCYKSYHNTATQIGGERFSIRADGEVTAGNPAYYILRPEVVESYFYLWRLTKDNKYREWAWESAQAIEKHCKAKYGYAGLHNVNDHRSDTNSLHDDLQRSFFLAETLKYLYLIFSDDDLISLDEFIFNTEAHPLIINQ